MFILIQYHVMQYCNDGDGKKTIAWVYRKKNMCGCSLEKRPSISQKCVALEYGVRDFDIGILCSILITCEIVIGDDYIGKKITQRGLCNTDFLWKSHSGVCAANMR